MSNLYVLHRKGNIGYDEYDSCIVVADTMENAKYIYPNDNYVWNKELQKYGFKMFDGTIEYSLRDHHEWDAPDDLDVILIGEASDTLTEGDIICASFNAG